MSCTETETETQLLGASLPLCPSPEPTDLTEQEVCHLLHCHFLQHRAGAASAVLEAGLGSSVFHRPPYLREDLMGSIVIHTSNLEAGSVRLHTWTGAEQWV